jgi:spore photoproduct lyase
MFNHIFIEDDLINHPVTKKILTRLKNNHVNYINDINDHFASYKKPYLEKRDNLNLYLAKKKGQLVKLAPDAYGLGKVKHYYFIHAYNCIYECEYCYLQGHFNSPDIVIFVNHDEIIDEIKKIALNQDEVWFHAGEFSDSLALSHLTGEIALYHNLLKDHPNIIIELRTKSANIKELINLKPLKNLITTFSLSPSPIADQYDHKTASIKARINAINELTKLNHPIGIHFDPIIFDERFKELYTELVSNLSQKIELNKILYFSLGVVRFTKDVYHQFKQNYPQSSLSSQEMITSFDGKRRYPKPIRMWMMNTVKNILLEHGANPENIYLCMEQDDN